MACKSSYVTLRSHPAGLANLGLCLLLLFFPLLGFFRRDVLHRWADFGNQGVTAGSKLFQIRGVLCVLCQVLQLVRVVLEIVKEFVWWLVGSTDIIPGVDPVGVAHTLPARDRSGDGEELAEKVGTPVGHRFPFEERHETAAGMAFGNRKSGQVDQGGADVAVQGYLGQNPSAFGFRCAWVVNNQRDAQGLLVVRPFPGKATVPEVVAVVGGVDDDGVVRQSLGLELLNQSPSHVINAADHAEVGTHVGLVFLRCVPAPEKPLSVDRFFQEVRLRFVDRRVFEFGEWHLLVFVHAIGDLGPGEVSDARSLVAIFSMCGVEAELQAEWFVFWLLFEELDPPVPKYLGFMARAAVWLLLEKWVAAELSAHVEHGGGGFFGKADVLLAEVAGAVARAFEHGEVGGIEEGWIKRSGLGTVEVFTFVATGEQAGPADPASRRRDEGVLKAHTLLGESVEVGCFDDRVTGASQGVITLVVGVE